MRKVAVLGAGITGITTAYALLNRGFEVTVFDRERYAAMVTSFANGGQLSASNAEVWNHWATLLKGLRWMFKANAPLLINPKPSWLKYAWLAEFVANLGRYERNTVETVRLAISARGHLLRYAELEGIEFDQVDRGILHIYHDRASYAHAARVNELLASGGLQRRAVSGAELREIEPALTGEYIGGFYTETDFSGDIHRYTRGLADACERKGATMHYATEIDGVAHRAGGVDVRYRDDAGETSESRFDMAVVCAGVGSRDLARQLGDRVNVYPVKGYSITVNLDDELSQAAAPWTSLLDDDAKIVSSRLGRDRLRIAGTAEFNGASLDIRADRIRPLVDWCRRLFPEVSTEHCVPWAGLRPMMPDMMPRVGAGRRSGVFYNTGHGHLGWTLSAATAELVADAMLGSIEQRPRASVSRLATVVRPLAG
jgi:D-amino-acid dehydrogenase